MSVTAAFSVGALALAACSGGGGEEEEGAPESQADGPVTLDFWAWGSNVDLRVEEWNAANPDIQVDISAPVGGADFPVRVLSAVRAGEGPDMAQAEYTQMPTYVSAGVLAPLNDSADMFADKFSENVMETVTFDDTIFGIPQDLGPVLFVHRSDLFEEHGLTPATTWSEYRDLAEQVRTVGDGDVYLGNFSSLDADLFMGLALQNGAQWWSYADGEWAVNIDDAATQEVLDYWADLIENDLVSTHQTNSPEYIEAVASRRIAGTFAGAWAPGPLMNQYPDTVGMWTAAQIPQWDPSDPVTFARGGSANVVLEDTEHYEQSVEFLTWLNASDEGAEGLVEVNKFTGAEHGQQIDRDPPELMPENEDYWPAATESAQHLATVQWGPNTQVAFTAINDELAQAIQSGEWDGVLARIEEVVANDLNG